MIEDLLKQLTYNQAKLIKALMKSPTGLLSKELAGKTKVSNKSATLTPDVRNLLKDHGFELKIERSAGEDMQALWSIHRIDGKPIEYNCDDEEAEQEDTLRYPSILQMIPVQNVYALLEDKGKRFIVNVTCMALIRFYDGDKYYDDIRYILMDSYGYPGEFDDYPSTLIKFFYSDTKPMLDLLDK